MNSNLFFYFGIYLELSNIVFNRWAIVRTVQSENLTRIVFCIKLSVLWSMAAVASSSMRIFVFLSSALVKQINCRWPTLDAK